MSRWHDLSDEELGAALADDLGRQQAAPVAPWVRRDLVAAVRSRIAPRRARAAGSRLAPLAAGSAVILLLALIVVAAPSGPGGPSPSPTRTPPSSWSGMNTREFAEALAAGQLRGQTVVVTGELRPLRVRCGGPDVCGDFALAGTSPLIGVQTRPLPAPVGVGFETDEDGVEWRWWQRPAVPYGQPTSLVLAVTAEGMVEFVGSESEEPMGVNSLRLVDPSTWSPWEVAVVPGWLTTAGVDLTSSSPQLSPVPGLPQRWSGPSAWVLDRAVAVDRQSDVRPQDGVRVQNGAFEQHVRDAMPATTITQAVAGLWAIAPRLEGAGCPEGEAPPCWQWNVVGRVTYQEADLVAGPAPTPPASAQPTTLASSTPSVPSPTSTRSAAAVECRRVGTLLPGTTPPPLGWTVSLRDATGLVDSCTPGARIEGSDPDPIVVQSGYPPRGALSVAWMGDSCRPIVSVSFESAGDTYVLRVDESPSPGAGSCKPQRHERWLMLWLSEPIGDWLVTPALNGETGPVAAPTPMPVPGEPRGIDCLWDDITVIDYAGTIDWCTPLEVDAAPSQDVPPSNPDGDNRRLRVHWRVSDVCGRMPSEVEVRAANDGRFAVTVIRNVAEDDYGCSPPQPGWRSIDLYLLHAVGAADVEFHVADVVAISTMPERCGLEALVSGHLVTHPDSGLGLLIASGSAPSAVTWPPGFSARRQDGVVVLVSPDGSVAAREGDWLSFGGGGAEGRILACGPLVEVREAP